MLDHNNIADLEKVNGRWELSFFVPGQPAFMYDDMEGKRGVLYAIKCEQFCKIGMTTNIEKRLRSIDAGVPFPTSLIAKKTVPLVALAYSEAWVHKQLSSVMVKNEWFLAEATEAKLLLDKASLVAGVYTKKCREWFYADREKKAGDPIYQARMKKEYAEFIARNATRQSP